jgi:hypothetical protein
MIERDYYNQPLKMCRDYELSHVGHVLLDFTSLKSGTSFKQTYFSRLKVLHVVHLDLGTALKSLMIPQFGEAASTLS